MVPRRAGVVVFMGCVVWASGFFVWCWVWSCGRLCSVPGGTPRSGCGTLRYMALVAINLRLGEAELDILDDVRGDVPRTVWIRGAIRRRLAGGSYGYDLDEKGNLVPVSQTAGS